MDWLSYNYSEWFHLKKFTQKIPFKGNFFLEICFHLILMKYLYVEKQGWEFTHLFSKRIARFAKKWAIAQKTSDSLIFGERPEQIPYGRSFLVSSLRDLLTLIIFGERPDDLQWAMGEWVMNKWANSQPCKWVTVS